MMGPKDYSAIAAIFKRMRSNALTTREHGLLTVLTAELAEYCGRQNANFKPEMFIPACQHKEKP